MGVSRADLTKWTEELRPFWQEISKVKSLHNQKKLSIDFKDFHNWYKTQSENKCCHYCEVSEKDLVRMIDQKIIETKRLRGRKLELDRKIPNLKYDELENLVWACYWCNNAKTDTFSDAEFKEIAKGIKQVWENRLKDFNMKTNKPSV